MDRRQKLILVRVAGVFLFLLGIIAILPTFFVARHPPPAANPTVGLVAVGLFALGAILLIIGWQDRDSGTS